MTGNPYLAPRGDGSLHPQGTRTSSRRASWRDVLVPCVPVFTLSCAEVTLLVLSRHLQLPMMLDVFLSCLLRCFTTCVVLACWLGGACVAGLMLVAVGHQTHQVRRSIDVVLTISVIHAFCFSTAYLMASVIITVPIRMR